MAPIMLVSIHGILFFSFILLFPKLIIYVYAWTFFLGGGNYFIAGGEVKGKRIIGEYPHILSEDGPLIFEPGIVIPTKP